MIENDISGTVLDCAISLHRRLGPGLLESVYEEVLTYELRKRGLRCSRQEAIPLVYDSLRLETAFRADIVVEHAVILELKSIESLLPVHKKQLLTYLRLSGFHLGILINFNVPLIRDGFVCIVNRL
ncbi:MAG: GxxExxY protein [Bacteroidetes bacterium]|nr:GxxExxY protein [Bacteroidota bacterium]